MTPIPLHRTDRNTKILITLFLVSMLAAFGVAGLNIYNKVGRTKTGVSHRYGAEEQSSTSATSAAAEELPLERTPGEPASDAEMLSARLNTFGALLDITHPHIFQIPLLLFVLSHFLMRTRVSEPFKLANYCAAFGGMIAFIAAPWLVRYSSVSWAPLLYIGASLMGITVGLMVVITIWDTWRPGCTEKTAKRNATR